jgi:hypothetical protein
MFKGRLLLSTFCAIALWAAGLNPLRPAGAAEEIEVFVGAAGLSFQLVDMGNGSQHLYLRVSTERKFAAPAQIHFTFSLTKNRIGVMLTGIKKTKAFLKEPEPACAEIDLTAAMLELKNEAVAPEPAYIVALKSGKYEFNITQLNTGRRPIRPIPLAAFTAVADGESGSLTIETTPEQQRDHAASPLTLPARRWKLADGKLSALAEEKGEQHKRGEDEF